TLTSEANGIYVSQKDNTGFTVRELQNGTSNATFDWMVIATRKMEGNVSEVVDESVITPTEEIPTGDPAPVEENIPPSETEDIPEPEVTNENPTEEVIEPLVEETVPEVVEEVPPEEPAPEPEVIVEAPVESVPESPSVESPPAEPTPIE
ncbi:MAG: hypothetical protein V1848_01445, partial [Candidatus Magasanikbacteria bacterium]